MALPAELLQAVSATGGGKLAFVIGAGCSLEAPTAIPLAGRCSEECHDRLVENGIFAKGECATPWDLSCLADTVVSKTGSQKTLVDMLADRYSFKTATPNDGYLFAAALLAEGAITSIVTLNFDLAMSMAIGQLGVGDVVAIIEGPEHFPNQKANNLYYIHRNASAADPESWVLRTEALAQEWKDHWESVVATKALSAPVVVFAGLGSPAAVLTESIRLIRAAIPSAKVFQVDPVEVAKSRFFASLALDAASYIQLSWCEFMVELAQRLVVEHGDQLRAAATAIVKREGIQDEDLTPLLARLKEIGLCELGHLRASWLMYEKPYHRDVAGVRELVADLMLAVAMVARTSGADAIVFGDGVVEFRRADRIVGAYLLASGRGSCSTVAVETELKTRKRRLRHRSTQPQGAIVAGTRTTAAIVTPPVDIMVGDTSGSIISGPSDFSMLHVDVLRQDPTLVNRLAP